MSGKVCGVEGCKRRYDSRGYCKAHAARLRRHGDPLAGGTATGAAREYLNNVVLTYQGDECLGWPFFKDKDGYARVNNGVQKSARVARMLCKMEHGAAPTPRHEAAHSCGKSWCVSRAHVSWKTPVENAADKLIHGTDPRGEKCGTSKLTASQVVEIRSVAGVVPRRELAARFGVTSATVRAVEKRKTWAWLNDPIVPATPIRLNPSIRIREDA